ncbi:hypothetical protein J2X90_001548 [Variovorax paradoxus]|uniref:hypothetical protein n=1 Tax=Variovorax paradoxus TaxID=34073 RepID=UPI00278A0EE5|nr:hypothetical protein [Variovorax paradoxus]MDQ0023753.1 hypothetical protein [Variovorax paradoxus]
MLLTIRAPTPNLVELKMTPASTGIARFGLVILRHRTEAPALSIMRELMDELLLD